MSITNLALITVIDQEEGTYGKWHGLCFACAGDMKDGVVSRVVSCERGGCCFFFFSRGGAECAPISLASLKAPLIFC